MQNGNTVGFPFMQQQGNAPQTGVPDMCECTNFIDPVTGDVNEEYAYNCNLLDFFTGEALLYVYADVRLLLMHMHI